MGGDGGEGGEGEGRKISAMGMHLWWGGSAYRQGVFSINKNLLYIIYRICTCDATFPFTCNHN